METQTTGERLIGGSEPHRRRSVPPPSQVDGKTHDGRPQSGHQAMHEIDENGDRRKTGLELDSSWIQAGGRKSDKVRQGKRKVCLGKPDEMARVHTRECPFSVRSGDIIEGRDKWG